MPPSHLQQVQPQLDQWLESLPREHRELQGRCHLEVEEVARQEVGAEEHYPEVGERNPKCKHVSSYTSSQYRPRSGGGNLYAI